MKASLENHCFQHPRSGDPTRKEQQPMTPPEIIDTNKNQLQMLNFHEKNTKNI